MEIHLPPVSGEVQLPPPMSLCAVLHQGWNFNECNFGLETWNCAGPQTYNCVSVSFCVSICICTRLFPFSFAHKLMACCYKLSVNETFVGVASLMSPRPPLSPRSSKAESRFSHVCMGRIFGVDSHGTATDMTQRRRAVCVRNWGGFEWEWGSPSVLVFCQGVPIDLLNLCDWNKCKWRWLVHTKY